MEHCPNCGASGRAGAKFCTTCGYRFPGADEESSPDEPTQPVAAESNGDERAADEPVAPTVTWPAPPAAETAGEAGWPRETVTVAETESDGEESDELLSTTWPSDKADFWPSPFAPTAAPALGDNDDTETAMDDEPSPGAAAASQEALTRAERLAEELRVALASVRVTAGPDLRAVAVLELLAAAAGARLVDADFARPAADGAIAGPVAVALHLV